MPLEDMLRDSSRGAMLCETCWDAMTDLVLSGAWTTTGLDEACCAGCWPIPLPPSPFPFRISRCQAEVGTLETHDDRIDSLRYAVQGMIMQWNAVAPGSPDTNRGGLGDLMP
jgi:hypothetical protein